MDSVFETKSIKGEGLIRSKSIIASEKNQKDEVHTDQQKDPLQNSLILP